MQARHGAKECIMPRFFIFGIKENLRCMTSKVCYTKDTTVQAHKEEEP